MGGGTLYRCTSCGNVYEDKDSSSEERTLCTIAFELLRKAEFDEAEEAFGSVLARFPKNAEAYWGLLLVKYGVVFVDDVRENKKVPTCYKASIDSVVEDDLFRKAVKYAPKDVAESYRALAEKIEKIRAEWVQKAQKEPPYDVFICFKDSDREAGIERTPDSYEAQNLYTFLTQKGYKVFFSRETLRSKVAEQYEPYIFGAISTAPVMVVYGQKREYFESVWMKNEWSRFIKRIVAGEKPANGLVVAYENMDAYDLPPQLRSRQCLNAGEKTFYPVLSEHIEKVLQAARTPVPQIETVAIKGGQVAKRAAKANVEAISQRELGGIRVEQITPDEAAAVKTGYMFLESGMTANAAAVFADVRARNGNAAEAIWGEMLCGVQAKNNTQLIENCAHFRAFPDFAKAVECADAMKANEYIEVFYQCANKLIDNGLCNIAIQFFKVVAPYKTKKQPDFIEHCLIEACKLRNEALMSVVLTAVDVSRVDRHIEAMNAFADNHLKSGDWDIAKRWYGKVLEIDEGNVNALRGVLKCGIGCKILGMAYDSTVVNIKDYPLFEKLLRYCPSIAVEVSAVVGGLTEEKSALTEADTAIAAFDTLIKYFPPTANKRLIEALYGMADKLLHGRRYEAAERYFAMIVTVDKKEYRAYWGLLLAKLKCDGNNKLIHCRTDITTVPEFNSAVTAAGIAGDTEFAKNCIALSAKRVEQVKKDIAAEEAKAIATREDEELAEIKRITREIEWKKEKRQKAFRWTTQFISIALAIAALGIAISATVFDRYLVWLVPLVVVLEVGVTILCRKVLWEKIHLIAFSITAVLCFCVTTGMYIKSWNETMVVNGFNLRYETSENGIMITGIKGLTDEYNGDLIIPEEYRGNTIICIGDSAFASAHPTSMLSSYNLEITEKYNKLISITIPQSVKIIGKDAFKNCINLKEVRMGNGVTRIGESAFLGCKKLLNIVIPDSVEIIDSMAFCACNNLSNIEISNNLTIIGSEAFSGCYELINLKLGNGIKSIGATAFEYELKNIFYNGTVEEWNGIEKGRDWMGKKVSTLGKTENRKLIVRCVDGTLEYNKP